MPKYLSRTEKLISRLKGFAAASAKSAADAAALAAELETEASINRQVSSATRAKQKTPSKETTLLAFIEQHCFYVPGERVTFSDFRAKFTAWLQAKERSRWHAQAIFENLPDRFPYGKGGKNIRYVCNMSFEDIEPKPDAEPLVVVSGRINVD